MLYSVDSFRAPCSSPYHPWACSFCHPMDQSTNSLLVAFHIDHSAIKTQIKTRTRALASLSNGDSPHLYLIPILLPLRPLQTITPPILIRHPEATTLFSTTIKQATCTLQAWDSSWGRLSRSPIQQARAIQQMQ